MSAAVLAPAAAGARPVRSGLFPFDTDRLVSYWLPAVFAAVSTFRWFTPGRFIGNGDVSPLIRRGLEAEAGSFWGHQQTGAGGTAADAGRLVEVFVIRAARAMGGSELLAQRLLFVAVMVFAAVGAAHLARLVLRRPAAVAVAAILAVCNPFLLLLLPNPIFPLAIGALGLLMGEVLAPLVGRPFSRARLVWASLPLAYLSINPSLVVVVGGLSAMAFVLVTGMVSRRDGRRIAQSRLLVVPVLLAVHVWWIVPLAWVSALGADGVTFAAVTDPEAWTWVYQQNGLDRVATLTAHWGWPYAEYFPWSATLDQQPWVVLRWVLPVGALAGAVFADRSRRAVAWSLAGSAMVVIVLSQGLHAPGDGINRFLYDHAPGWWLFRDPTSKFGVILVLLYAILFGLLVERVLDHRPSGTRVVALAAVTIAAVVHPFPLLTGSVIPDERGQLPSAHVAVPHEWDELAETIGAADGPGKIAILPLNDYYQVTTTWGYHGVDLVPQLFDRPVVQRLPGGYFGERAGFDDLLVALEAAVADGNADAVGRVLGSLGASHLIIRHDVVDPAGASVGPPVDPAGLVGLDTVAATEVATVYARPDSSFVRAETLTIGAGAGSAAEVVVAGPGVAVDPLDHPARVQWTQLAGAVTFDTDAEDGEAAVSLAGSTEVPATASIADGALSVRLGPSIRSSGRILPTEALAQFPVTSRGVTAVSVDGELIPLDPVARFPVVDGTAVGLAVPQLSRAAQQSGPLSDCNRFDDRTPDEAGLGAFFSPDRVALSARAHTACVTYGIPSAAGPGLLTLSATTISGASARLCVWSDQDAACIIEDRVEDGEPDRRYLIPADARRGDLDLYLYADGLDDGTRTVVEFGDMWITDLEIESTTRIDLDGVVARLPLTDGPQMLAVDTDVASALGEFGGLGDCSRTDDRAPEEVGLALTRHATGVDLAAGAHAACVWAPVDAEPGSALIVDFEATVLGGAPPRFCLWQHGAEQCADAPAVVPDADGHVSYREQLQTDPSADRLELYLYADGRQNPTTEIEYRNVRVEAAGGLAVTVSAADESAPVPDVDTVRRDPGRYDVGIEGAEGTFTLVLPESYADGWSLSGLPDGWTAEHIEVDGYANGWRVTGEGDADVHLSFGPGAVMRWGNRISMLTAAGLVLATLAAAATSRRRLADIGNGSRSPRQ